MYFIFLRYKHLSYTFSIPYLIFLGIYDSSVFFLMYFRSFLLIWSSDISDIKPLFLSLILPIIVCCSSFSLGVLMLLLRLHEYSLYISIYIYIYISIYIYIFLYISLNLSNYSFKFSFNFF
jgi:hypothetical protein